MVTAHELKPNVTRLQEITECTDAASIATMMREHLSECFVSCVEPNADLIEKFLGLIEKAGPVALSDRGALASTIGAIRAQIQAR